MPKSCLKENRKTEKNAKTYKCLFYPLYLIVSYLEDGSDFFYTEMPTTTEYVNQYFKLEMFIILF